MAACVTDTRIQMDTQKDKDRRTPAEATTNTLLTHSLLTPTPNRRGQRSTLFLLY